MGPVCWSVISPLNHIAYPVWNFTVYWAKLFSGQNLFGYISISSINVYLYLSIFVSTVVSVLHICSRCVHVSSFVSIWKQMYLSQFPNFLSMSSASHFRKQFLIFTEFHTQYLLDRILNKIKNVFEVPCEAEGFSENSHLKRHQNAHLREMLTYSPHCCFFKVWCTLTDVEVSDRAE